MARRTGGTHKGVEEKRRSLPIYDHYTLSPGKTKSHHPEAKCNHCLKEFVCGSKQRLIRHLRKCNSISNPDQIIAETLNTLARNSATGTLNHSILEASNLLPSQNPHLHHHPHHPIVGHQQIQHSSPSSTATNITTANNNTNSNHNTSGSSCNDTGLIASSSNGSQQQPTMANNAMKRPQRRGRKPANQLASASPSIHVTTGLDGKTHFTPASQLPSTLQGTVGTPLIAQVHNGRPVGYAYHSATVSSTAVGPITTPGTHLSASNSGHLACATPNHHSTPYKLNSDPIDKAYLKLVLTRNLPLSLCDTKEFQLWVKTFANDYKPPSSINLIGQNLKNEAQAAKQRVSNILVKAPKKTINLELHNWNDKERCHDWFAVIANIDHKRFLISMRDIYVQIPNNTGPTHQLEEVSTTDKLFAEFIDDCIKRIGSDRINSLIFSRPSLSDGNDLFAIRARQSLYTSHPSIVTYYCWWNFTNLLCSDVIEHSGLFQNIMRNSNRLVNFVNKRPRLGHSLEKFAPFIGIANSNCQRQQDRRWYSHLVCYLLEYIKNNNEAIIRALEAYSPSSHQSQISTSDNNNNSSTGAINNPQQVGIHQNLTTTNAGTQHQQTILCQQELADLIEIKSIIMSTEYQTNLHLALGYLKPIQNIVALTSTASTTQLIINNTSSIPEESVTPPQVVTPSISPIFATNVSLGDYMNWFLKYGKTLFDTWRQAPDGSKQKLIERYLTRFHSSFADFKLLFAAYLLNPKHRCAYMTQKAKDTAIEEILNIASEFMPEESDGHTIFDQWKLYLVREEPYDMVFEENRSTPLEWWMSLPCAESIRRVALRILRLKAFTTPKPETLFSQLYFYEDEMKTILPNTTFEDIAVLRYFYDYEDKLGQPLSHGSLHNNNSNTVSTTNHNNNTNSSSSNGCLDRTQVGQLHNHQLYQSDYYPTKLLPSENLDIASDTNGQTHDSMSISDGRQSFSDSFSDVVVEAYSNHNSHLNLDAQANLGSASSLSVEDLPGYNLFVQYIDYNELGVQVVDEPIEKKKRKWTAQEILSKCQSQNHQNSNNNEISSK